MTSKEISIRSIMFLVIGILLVLSLVICIHIVNNEKDLVPTKATVIKVREDKDATGKNEITVVYDVNNTTYQYSFDYKDDVKTCLTYILFNKLNRFGLLLIKEKVKKTSL